VVGKGPGLVAVDATTHIVYVLNTSGHSVSVIDARSSTLVRTLPVAGVPEDIAVDVNTGRAFVTLSDTNAVAEIDTHTLRILTTSRVGKTPRAVEVDSATHRVFVTNAASDTVSVLDSRTGHVLHTVSVGVDPYVLAIDRTAGHVLVLNSGPDALTNQPSEPGTVSILNAADGTLQHISHVDTNRGALLQSLAVDEPTHHAFVVNTESQTVTMLDTRSGAVLQILKGVFLPFAMASDSAIGRAILLTGDKRNVRIVDTRTGHVVASASIPNLPLWIAVHHNTALVVVLADDAIKLSSSVTVINAISGAVVWSLALPHTLLQGVAIDDELEEAFVADALNNDVLLVPLPGRASARP
jgi:YVTN family beta-propeller protein